MTEYQWLVFIFGGGGGATLAGFIINSMINKKIDSYLQQKNGTSTYIPRKECKENHKEIYDTLKNVHDEQKEADQKLNKILTVLELWQQGKLKNSDDK